MQLVPFTVHQKTCPHAGGCKLWSIEHNNSPYRADSTVYVNESLQGKLIAGRLVYKTGVINVGASEKTYCDFVIDYIFEEKTLRHITVKSSYNHWRGKRLCGNRIWGLDPYGNLFLVNDDGQLFFWSHETMEVCPVGISERDILKQ